MSRDPRNRRCWPLCPSAAWRSHARSTQRSDHDDIEKQNYVHLAAFARNGPTNKLKDVLKTSATALIHKVNTTSTNWWFSTSGHGVAWLHVRIEPRPKKYRHDAYKATSTNEIEQMLPQSPSTLTRSLKVSN